MRPKLIAWILFLCLLFSISRSAQSQGGRRPPIDGTVAPSGEDESRAKIDREMAKKANLERQASLKADTDKLLKLSGELKDYVDRSNENVLSLDVVKKAEEIEKLAHSVKEKMKGPN
jgi:hypothetical protein